MTALSIPFRKAAAPMTPAEVARRDEIHAELRTIQKPLHRGLALLSEVAEAHLYRDEYGTFAEYLVEEWGISPYHALRQIAALKIVDALPADLPKPSSEGSVRPLRGIKDPEVRANVYREAVESNGGNPPTASQVEVAVAKAKGYVPPNAVVEVTEPDPDDPTKPPATVPVPLTDEEWLATLPAREKIPAGKYRERFDADALFYRAFEPHRAALRKACSPLVATAEKAMGGGHKGRFLSRYKGFLLVQHPKDWRTCGDCEGACVMPTIGECPTCKSCGYQVN